MSAGARHKWRNGIVISGVVCVRCDAIREVQRKPNGRGWKVSGGRSGCLPPLWRGGRHAWISSRREWIKPGARVEYDIMSAYPEAMMRAVPPPDDEPAP